MLVDGRARAPAAHRKHLVRPPLVCRCGTFYSGPGKVSRGPSCPGQGWSAPASCCGMANSTRVNGLAKQWQGGTFTPSSEPAASKAQRWAEQGHRNSTFDALVAARGRLGRSNVPHPPHSPLMPGRPYSRLLPLPEPQVTTKLPYAPNDCQAPPSATCVKLAPFCSSRYPTPDKPSCKRGEKPTCAWNFSWKSPDYVSEEAGSIPAPQGACASSAADFTFST